MPYPKNVTPKINDVVRTCLFSEFYCELDKHVGSSKECLRHWRVMKIIEEPAKSAAAPNISEYSILLLPSLFPEETFPLEIRQKSGGSIYSFDSEVGLWTSAKCVYLLNRPAITSFMSQEEKYRLIMEANKKETEAEQAALEDSEPFSRIIIDD